MKNINNNMATMQNSTAMALFISARKQKRRSAEQRLKRAMAGKSAYKPSMKTEKRNEEKHVYS